MNKKAERGQATREQLISIATHSFAQHGYEGTSIEAVLIESGVSRGALYHHFSGKEALFEAVLESVESQIAHETVAATDGTTNPVSALRAGALAWIRLAGDPVVQRIVLIDAPSVIGWERWRAMEERYAFGMIKQTMAVLEPEHADMFAHMLLAALNEIALLIARTEGAEAQAKAMREGEAAVDEFLRRLL